ncbi:MAG: hypothetical protein H7840_06740 [Alphaproteobacteria bacterium]
MAENGKRPLPRGARVLPLDRLPGLEKLLDVVKVYRDRFQELERHEGNTNDPFGDLQQFHFHPVISILGGRGTGKTSALLTLLYNLRKNNSSDLILMPPLDPHRFVSNDRLINWLLAILETRVRKLAHGRSLDDDIPLTQSGYCPFRDEGNLGSSGRCRFSDLAPCHQRLAEKAFRLGEPQLKASDHETAHRFRNYYLAKGMNFPHHLDCFVRCLTQANKHRSGATENAESPPLLVLGIDDADLVPQYLAELLVFLRMTAFVRRLIIIVTLDEKLAYKTQLNHYAHVLFSRGVKKLRKLELISQQESEDILFGITDQFLVKFLPYEGRHSLHSIGLQERLDYRPYAADDAGREDVAPETSSLLQLLEQAGLSRLLTFSWACQDSIHAYPSPYRRIVPQNPRLLEDAYFMLFRYRDKERMQESPFHPNIHSDVCLNLFQLWVRAPYQARLSGLVDLTQVEVRGRADKVPVIDFDSKSQMEIVFRARATLRNTGAAKNKEILVLDDFVPVLHEIGEPSNLTSGEKPEALLAAYLFSQEFPHEEVYNRRGDERKPLPAFLLGRNCPNFPLWRRWKSFGPGTEKTVADGQVATYWHPYPLIVPTGDGFIGFSLPPWPQPSRWFAFLSFWRNGLQRLSDENPSTDKRTTRLIALWWLGCARFSFVSPYLSSGDATVENARQMEKKGGPEGALTKLSMMDDTSNMHHLGDVTADLYELAYNAHDERYTPFARWVEEDLLGVTAAIGEAGGNWIKNLKSINLDHDTLFNAVVGVLSRLINKPGRPPERTDPLLYNARFSTADGPCPWRTYLQSEIDRRFEPQTDEGGSVGDAPDSRS